MNQLMEELMEEYTEELMEECMEELMEECMEETMNEPMNECLNECMNLPLNQSMEQSLEEMEYSTVHPTDGSPERRRQSPSRKYSSLRRSCLCAVLLLAGTTMLTTLTTTAAAAAELSEPTVVRVFQALPEEPAAMDPSELSRMLRGTQAMVFGDGQGEDAWSGVKVALDVYSPPERRAYLVDRGNKCHPGSASLHGSSSGSGKGSASGENEGLAWYDVLARYDELLSAEMDRMALELWKFCVLFNGDGQVFLDFDGASLLRPLRQVVTPDANYGIAARDAHEGKYVHESFAAVAAPSSPEIGAMIRLILETSDDMLSFSPLLLPRELHRLVTNSDGAAWTLLQQDCIHLADPSNAQPLSYTSSSSSLHGLGLATPDAHTRSLAARCPLAQGGYCCGAYVDSTPMLALTHPVGGWSHRSSLELPYGSTHLTNELELELPYISTVHLIANGTRGTDSTSTSAATMATTQSFHTPNFFDILFENDCLPYRKECHRCLKDVSNEAEEDEPPIELSSSPMRHTMRNACAKCKLECPCYCDILCKVRPPPKKVVRTYAVHPPKFKRHAERLVPKIVHQTWFEPVTKDKYPNMSRLIESWKKSGWEYNFYDDASAGNFLSTHFPPEVREAYESITPGAFKADLFRYCVLLIRGGVYADMDVLLETHLDEAIADDIGFMTPIDEPGIDVGHRSCLWNGLIASAPGHPFLARTIEIVVNNIRNRFTAVDYDDMLCPNPILSVSHTVDTLFTCGPCILGAGINNLLGRHMQNQFEIGEVDIWQSEPKRGKDGRVVVSAEDPRLLIPGRTVVLEQDKNDMGAHRFTWSDQHLIIAATDMPDYDDRPPTKEHYSKTHEKAGVYGMRKLYTDNKRANHEIRIVVEKS